ncbi:MAG: TonB-dependent receptor [Motiliproteus sp.]|nr:TonB-dependent receptor [Motiliproteus sp.]MCW9052572.1 TonB-dependent receptor [Motiliproteus sp.]
MSKRLKPIVVSFVMAGVCSLSPAIALAMEEDDSLVTEDELLGAIPTFKSATNLEQKLNELPASITLIDRKMIKASGAINIADLFRLVPGFQVYHVNAHKFGVTIHGQGDTHPGRLEVTIDGRSVYLSLLSTVDWSALGIGIDDIDHIEVVRGSNIPTQGSNAFLGAINIVTRAPLQDQGTHISMTRGSLQTKQYSARHNGQVGQMDYRLSANFHGSNGHGVGYEDGDPSNPKEVIEDSGEISQLGFRGTYTPNLVDSFDIQLGYSGGNIGVGRAHSPDEFTKRDVQSHYQSLTWTRALQGDDEFKLQAYHNHLKYSETELLDLGDVLGPLAGIIVDIGIEKGVAERYDISADLTKRLGGNTRSTWSAGVRRESLRSQALLDTPDTLSETMFRASGNIEHRIMDDWTLNIGAMLEHNDLASTRLSPRVGLNYQINPEHSVRASASKAYRTPSLLENYQSLSIKLPVTALGFPAGTILDQATLSDPGIGPEEIKTYELGYIWQHPQQRWIFDAKIYLEEVSNAIEEARVAPSFGPIDTDYREVGNVTHWRTHGLELQWKYQPTHSTWFHLAYGYADAEGKHDRGISGVEDISDETPTHTLAMLASHNFSETLQASIAYYRLTSVFFDGGDNNLPPYKRVDLRLAKNFVYGNTEGSVELIVQNLGSNYTEFDLNNTFDTRSFLRFSLDFL